MEMQSENHMDDMETNMDMGGCRLLMNLKQAIVQGNPFVYYTSVEQ